jgi:hypothetical protein
MNLWTVGCADAHKLHSTPQQDRMNLISGKGETSSRLPAFSLFLPGSCPNYRDRRNSPVFGPKWDQKDVSDEDVSASPDHLHCSRPPDSYPNCR